MIYYQNNIMIKLYWHKVVKGSGYYMVTVSQKKADLFN